MKISNSNIFEIEQFSECQKETSARNQTTVVGIEMIWKFFSVNSKEPLDMGLLSHVEILCVKYNYSHVK